MRFLKRLLLLSFLLTTACAAAPDGHRIINFSALHATAPRVYGASGPLSAFESRRILEHIGIDDPLQRHLAIEQAVAENPLVAGNSTWVLRDGAETFPAMFEAIRNAHDHVYLEYYIFEDVNVGRQHLGDLLIKKRRQGVDVAVIYDSYGSSETPSSLFDRLEHAGVKIVKYNPLNPLEAVAGYKPNDRDHRKILAVDGAVGIVGGVNLSKTYLPHAVGKSMGPPGTLPEHWRDTDLEIVGPAVAQLEQLFIKHWHQQGGPDLVTHPLPPLKAPGSELVRIIGSAPDRDLPRYYVTLLSAIRNAQKSIFLMTAYFVPTGEEKEDLIHAARRGVDVRLLVPKQSDSPMAIAAQHAAYYDLLEAGVKIYESDGQVLHSKTVVVDGVWSVIGSSNFDFRSAALNDEVDAVVLGTVTGQKMENMFMDDIAQGEPVDPKKWRERDLPDRIYESFSEWWAGML
ncbi:MAG TPA: phospholipase D-like domain-containing protein [Patescibacteria group bacterium]|nr:phospholipase D-like domain-containing protein [Patescibacteria group bacterium]